MRTVYHFLPKKRPEAFKRVLAAEIAEGVTVVIVRDSVRPQPHEGPMLRRSHGD